MTAAQILSANNTTTGPMGSTAEVAIVATTVFLLEIGLLVFLSATMPLLVTAIHLLIAVSLLIWLIRRNHIVDKHFAQLLTVNTVALGPIGSGGSLLAILLSRLARRSPESVLERQRTLFPEIKQSAAEALCENLALGREQPASSAGVAPFADIAAVGSIQEKQTIIGHLARRFGSEFAPALNKLVTDGDAAVRVQAGTAITNIEKRYFDHIVRLEHQVEAAPDDLATLRRLARALDNFAHNGIVDLQRQRDVRTMAVAVYRRCIALAVEDRADRKATARLLVRLGRLAEAEPLLAGLCRTQPQQDTMYWYAECLFGMGRYEEVRTLVARMPAESLETDRLPHRLAPIIDFWQNTRYRQDNDQ